MASPEVRTIVVDSLRRFLTSSGRGQVKLNSRTHLTLDLDLKSDEGIDFVLELCDAFKHEFPANFNPFVQDGGRRGCRLGDLIDAVAKEVSREGAVT